MKKIFALILAIIISATFIACGSAKELTPAEKAQKRAVEIGEQVLNYEISIDEARKMLDEIIVPEDNIYLKADIDWLSFQLIGISTYRTNYEDIQEAVERIAERDYTN